MRPEFEEWRPIKGYEGLYEVSNLGNFRARIRTKGKQRWLGTFSTSAEASSAYQLALMEIRREK